MDCGKPVTIDTLTRELVQCDPAETYQYPHGGNWRFTHTVQESALQKVEAIHDRAISLGWQDARLYQNRGAFPFPYGEHYGLVCFIFEKVGTVVIQKDEWFVVRKRHIGAITRHHIEIIMENLGVRPPKNHPTRPVYYALHPFPVKVSLHFNNPDVGQSWDQRSKSANCRPP
jgi:hypothetical protein